MRNAHRNDAFLVIILFFLLVFFLKTGPFSLYRAAPSNEQAFAVIARGDALRFPDAAARLVMGEPIDINRATVQDLVFLPGIGQKLAQRVVARRQKAGAFHSPDELKGVRGIGDRKFQTLRPYIEAGPHPGGNFEGP